MAICSIESGSLFIIHLTFVQFVWVCHIIVSRPERNERNERETNRKKHFVERDATATDANNTERETHTQREIENATAIIFGLKGF